MTNLLLISNSRMSGRGVLEHVMGKLDEFLAARRTIHFVPFALADHDSYTATMRSALSKIGATVIGLHECGDPVAAIEQADVVFVGGGNSFRLLKELRRMKLLQPVKKRVAAGQLLYIGSSAGSNMACPTLRTTNDMPIVQPSSFKSFGLIPFQINPHYVDADPSSKHMGETREKRIAEFHEENAVPVVGLREGAWLHRLGDRLALEGVTGGRLFLPKHEPIELAPGADLSYLLKQTSRFDSRGKAAASLRRTNSNNH